MRRALIVLALLVAGCAAPPVSVERSSPPPPASPSPSPTPTPSPLVPRATTPPAGPDAFSCTERLAIPDIADVIAAAWSPDGETLVLSHTVPLPSARITGSPEDFFLDALDLRTGDLTPLGVGERVQWSASGKYLSYWSWDGDLRVAVGGRVIALPQATIPDVRWVGDTLYFFAKDEIHAWSDAGEQTISRLPAELEPHYPADDASFSGDAERFTITRYSLDGTTLRYFGVTGTGSVSPLDAPDATYTEWAPSGATLLVRSPGRLEQRSLDGAAITRTSVSAEPVHVWTPDGRALLLGPVTPSSGPSLAFDTYQLWGPDEPAKTATLPNLLGPRRFSPNGAYFVGDSRTSLVGSRLEIFRCGTPSAARPTIGPPAGATALPADRRFERPVVGAITQVVRPGHTGIDIAAPLGSLLTAADDGIVTAVGWVPVGGRRVCVGHATGVVSCDYHTSAALVHVGDRVVRGQPVALVGLTGVTTGPHVHWEATIGDRIVDPLTR